MCPINKCCKSYVNKVVCNFSVTGVRVEDGESPLMCVKREIIKELGVIIRPGEFINNIKHSYSYFSISMDVFKCKFISGYSMSRGHENLCWIYLSEIYNLAFPHASHKIFHMIKAFGLA